MKVPELKSDKNVIRWLRNSRASQNTRETYLTGLQFYTEFTNMSPTELIEEARKEINDHVELVEQSMYQYVPDFRLWLESKGHAKKKDLEEFKLMIEFKPWLATESYLKEWLNSKPLAPYTVESRVRSIRSFYKYNGIIYISMERRGSKPLPLESNYGIPTKEEIREVLKVCKTPLERAIVLVGASSGLASNEIINLRIKDFKNGYCKEDGITTLTLVRAKTNYKFVTFLTKEASQAVLDYIKYRNRASRAVDPKTKYRREQKRKISIGDGYLFISKFISNEYLKTHDGSFNEPSTELLARDEELRKLSNDAIQNIYRSMCEDTGLSAKPGNWNNMRSHKLRKWFSNMLRKAKCDPDLREFMMGHKIEGSKASYYVDDTTELKAAYKDCAYLLTIEKSLDISESEDFQRLKQLSETQAKIIEIGAEAQRKNVDELAAVKAELEAEKAAQPEREAALMKRILDALAANDQKKIDSYSELTDEQYEERNKPENVAPGERAFEKSLDGLHNVEVPPDVLPEEDSVVIKRALKGEKKKD